uniref:DUF4218 domain-containing protein n=1 Tax=Cannabis sativa TaxID=3483 RepID=A0A803PU07_CANSA
MCYMGHRRFLPEKHYYRKQKLAFNGEQELREAPIPMSGEDIYKEIHLMENKFVHLVREVRLCGPVCFRWMYPFERLMKVYKGYVRNRNRPEGCIVEAYIAEEAVEFCSEYITDVETIGPNIKAIKHKGFAINGYMFSTKARDKVKVTQNSGVCIVAQTLQFASARDKNPFYGDMKFYGVIEEIWELDYRAFRIAMFKCNWVDDKIMDHLKEELEENEVEDVNVEEELEEFSSDDLATKKKKNRKTKGIVRLAKIIADKIKGIKMYLKFNKRGQSIGTPERALQCYLGMQAKSMVPITIDNWHDVPAATLENVWKDVNLAFHFNDGMKKEVMSSVGNKWRAFKTYLNRKFISPFIDNPKLLKENPSALHVPPKRYSIREEEWKVFVSKRQTKEFQEFRKKQQERRAALEYPHHSSRRSYKQIEFDLQTELDTDEPIDRSILWKEARKNASGKYVNECDKHIGDAIDGLLDKRKEGSLVEIGTNDILTQVLGKPEHPGRVRGQSRGVTQRDYFLKPTKGFSGLQQQQFEFQQHQSRKYLEDIKKLEQSFEQKLSSQAEQDELVFVWHAIGNFVEWPSHLTIPYNIDSPPKKTKKQKRTSSPVTSKNDGVSTQIRAPIQFKIPSGIPRSLKSLLTVVKYVEQGFTIKIPMDFEILGHEHILHIAQDDIVPFGLLDKIGRPCILLYIRFLYFQLVQRELDHFFRFVEPIWLSNVGSTEEERVEWVSQRMVDSNPGQLWLLPYHLDVFRYLRTSNTKAKEVMGKTIKCPRQPLGSLQCGFYVLRMMKDFVMNEASMRWLTSNCGGKTSYTKDEINEVRDEWAQYITELMKST